MRYFILLISFVCLFIGISLAGEFIKIDSMDFKWQSDFKVIECIDEMNCGAFGNLAFRQPFNRVTYDGGQTWHTTLLDTTTLFFDDSGKITGKYTPPQVISANYVNQKFCIVACDSGYYWLSTDNMISWKKGKIENAERGFGRPSFINEKVGGFKTGGKKVHLTKNGLENQEVVLDVRNEEENTIITDIQIINEESVFIIYWVQDKGYHFARSDDWGKTWSKYGPFERTASRINMLDSKTGFVVGSPQLEPGSQFEYGVIYKTTDGGESWEKKLDTIIMPSYGLQQVKFWDKTYGYALGRYELWNTTDGGETWEKNYDYHSDATEFPLADIAVTGPGEFIGVNMLHQNIYRYVQDPNSVETPAPFNFEFKEKAWVYPNVVESGGEIVFVAELAKSARGRLSACDVRGSLVWGPAEVELMPGPNKISFPIPSGVSKGLYYITLTTPERAYTTKIIVD